jgi:hypothetical protein
MGESSYVAHGCREVFLDPIFGPTCRRVSLCLFTSTAHSGRDDYVYSFSLVGAYPIFSFSIMMREIVCCFSSPQTFSNWPGTFPDLHRQTHTDLSMER